MKKRAIAVVAPFAGAWIEIHKERGRIRFSKVAPFAGAWIEIVEKPLVLEWTKVAPFAGAWIEIVYWLLLSNVLRSRSLRGSVD